MQYETVWSFNTARFTVSLAIAPEDFDPAEQFEDDEDVEFAREGGWHWFQARTFPLSTRAKRPKRIYASHIGTRTPRR